MSLTVQLNTMLVMTAMGIWIGIAMDTYGRFVNNRKWFRWIFIINDCLFWLVQALLVFYVLLVVNQGDMRFYTLLALLLGYATYQALLRNMYQRFLERLIYSTILTLRFFKTVLFVFIVNPTKCLLKLLHSLCMMIVTLLLALLLFFWNCIYNPVKWIAKTIWYFVPKHKFEYFKNNNTGFFLKVKNVKNIVRKWFASFKDK